MRLFVSGFFFLAFLCIVSYYSFSDKNYIRRAPIEFINKKSIRKEFKNNRKDWMENMHRSHPDDDWRLIDKNNRKKNTDEVRLLRKNIVSNNSRQYLRQENISRDIIGEWSERGSNNLSGRILTADIDFNNNLIYCVSDGGNIWKGSLNGEDWTSLNDYMQIKGVHFIRIINHNNNNRILVSSSNQFYYTDDEGLTFNEPTGLNFLNSGGSINRVVIKEDSLNTIYLLSVESSNFGGSYSAIYKSVDHGQNFERIIVLNAANGFSNLSNNNQFDIWTLRYFESDLYLLHDNEFYMIDSNNNINFISNVPTSSSGENVLIGGQNNNTPFLYARIDEEIYFSMNGGQSWSYRSDAPQWIFTRQNSFNSSILNSNIVFWGGMEAFKSVDSGQSWDLVNNWWDYYDNPDTKLHADIPEIRPFLNNEYEELYLISTDGGIYISYDILSSTQNLSFEGLGVSQYYSTYTKRSAPYSIYAGSQDQGFQRSINDMGGVLDFEQSISGDYGHLVSGDGGQTLWCNYPGFTMFYLNPDTDTGGRTLDFPGSGHLWLAPLMENPSNPYSVYLGGGGLNGGNHIIELTYQNNTIIYEELSYNFNATISAMSYSPLEINYRYILTENGKFYYSNDSGENWQLTSSFTGPSPQYFYGSTILPSNTNFGVVYIGGSGYSNYPVYVSYDNGQNFESFSNGLPNTLVYELCTMDNDDLLFAATEVGPYVYSFSENQWLLLSGLTAPDQTYWSCEYIPELQTIRFGTYGRGIWDFKLDENYEISFGDVNNDSVINIQDIILVIGFILNNIIPSEIQFLNSDLNQDEEINVLDIMLILDLILDG
ncbi:MAG: hypothetical protein CMG64_00750 [Candidatus Marinimicrobia bacterium]|nr:hypothetical protein [Candidatus Neomarinimicrobiota bacterium]|tara:strand:- start:10559 stop:13033 length:2475 start_codon:yes stop_codon:yes gene_type:complete